MPALAAIALGIGLGFVCGGSLSGISTAPIRGGGAIVIMYALQAIARGRILGIEGFPHLGLAVWVACSIVLSALLVLGWQAPGLVLAAAGISLNLVVVLLNGGMPVAHSLTAVESAQMAALPLAQVGFYQVVGAQTLGAVLGDVLPLGIGRAQLLLSVGDVLLVVGVCTWIVAAMCADQVRRKSDSGGF